MMVPLTMNSVLLVLLSSSLHFGLSTQACAGYNNGKCTLKAKRMVEKDFFGRDIYPRNVFENRGIIEKRDSTVYDVAPPGSSELLPSWAALPYETCGFTVTDTLTIGTTTTVSSALRICPWYYACACQGGGSSMCVGNPGVTTVASITTSCTALALPYPVTSTCSYYWAKTLQVWASPYGQCGGYTGASVGQPWTTATICPTGQACSCSNFYNSVCVSTPTSYDTASLTCTATNNAQSSHYWNCNAASVYPTTAPGLNQQCGGVCMDLAATASRVCATGFCYTQTWPDPGGYAECAVGPPTDMDGVFTEYQQTVSTLCYPVPFVYTSVGEVGPSCSAGQCVGAVALNSAQCGGIGWPGPYCCGGGQVCSTQTNASGTVNSYYAQCVTTAGWKKNKRWQFPLPARLPVPARVDLNTPGAQITASTTDGRKNDTPRETAQTGSGLLADIPMPTGQ